MNFMEIVIDEVVVNYVVRKINTLIRCEKRVCYFFSYDWLIIFGVKGFRDADNRFLL